VTRCHYVGCYQPCMSRYCGPECERKQGRVEAVLAERDPAAESVSVRRNMARIRWGHQWTPT